MKRRSLAGVVLTMLVIFAGGAGCGESAEEEALLDWQAHFGPAWDSYIASYQAGWERGCVEKQDALLDENPELIEGLGLGALASCSPPSTPRGQTPVTPPSDPEDQGYEDGRFGGCMKALRHHLGEDDLGEDVVSDAWRECVT